jgi:hypothetical protein
MIGWPWLLWLWQAAAVGWPELSQEPLWRAGRWLLWQGQRVLLVGYVGMALYQVRLVAREEIAFGQPVDFYLGWAASSVAKRKPGLR